ncbi:9837_t:CDS:2 [Ambispora leptoticha]|uniref:9837_t:CDS:1 n=1 Tax=Ambispora leptoticha TaxID=144679 RepID=A0A9N8VII4_9GLOM|nr:9837_t:CDS:2 [Ambispora leptoticha]
MSVSPEVAGMFAIVSFSTLSNTATTGMLIWISLQRHPNLTVSRLVLNMLFSDWLQSVGFIMSLYWISQGSVIPGMYCDLQGIIINIGDVSSAFWATAICLHTYLAVVHSIEPRWFLQITMGLVWPINIFISVIGLYIQTPDNRFFDSAGGSWCWISPKHGMYRIIFHYGIITILALVMLVLYGLMFIMLRRQQESIEMSPTKIVLQRTGKKLIYYPAAYIVLVFPLSFQRYLAFFGITLPFQYLIFAGCVFASAGLVNSLIYGFTRHVVALKPLFEREYDEKVTAEIAKKPATIFGDSQNIFVAVSPRKSESEKRSGGDAEGAKRASSQYKKNHNNNSRNSYTTNHQYTFNNQFNHPTTNDSELALRNNTSNLSSDSLSSVDSPMEFVAL